MKKLILLLLLSSTLHAAVTMVANKPTGQQGSDYGFLVIPGSQRQITTHLTGGTTYHVNWSILSTTGGATATLSNTTNAINLTNVTIGSVGATCSVTGTLGAYVVSTTATVTVRAQSVDDTTKTADFVFRVCNPGATTAVIPAYQQVYKTQPAILQSYVIGNVNEAVTWSILSQPSGGDGALADTNKRDTVLTATVTGRYSLQACSVVDTSKCATAIVYVSANTLPSYGLSTPNGTMSTPCDADPAFTGVVYEVGPTQAITTINAINLQTWTAGSIVRVHNEDTTGTNPTVYHEGVRLMGVSGTATDGTPTQPKLFCGVPDSLGNLPIMDGSNATSGAPYNGLQTYGVVSVWGAAKSSYDFWSGGSDGTDYFQVSGLHIRNANPSYSYIDFTSHNAVAYGNFSSCINVRSGTNVNFFGNEMENCGNGMFIANNSARGWGQVTLFNDIRGNNLHDNGNAGDSGTHHIYVGSWYTPVEGNRFGNLVLGSGGDSIKDRGVESIHRYNSFQSNEGGYIIGMESETDSQEYITAEALLGAVGDTSCQNNYCNGETTLPMGMLAAYQEGLEKSFMYGNIYSSRSVALASLKLSDSGGAGDSFHNQSEMGDHLGITYFYSNTVDNPMLAIFGTLSGVNNGTVPQQQFMKPAVFVANNILYKSLHGSIDLFSFTRNASIVAQWQTNLMNSGSFNINSPQFGMTSTDINSIYGWHNYTDPFQYDGDGVTFQGGPLLIAIDTHQAGYTSPNFLSTPTKNLMPYNSFTYAPVTGGGAIGAATTITDPVASLMPVRFQYDLEHSRMIPRTVQTTIGAVDTGNQPTIKTLAEDPGTKIYLETTMPATMGNIFTPVSAKLLCTASNGLTKDCSPDAVWTPLDINASPNTDLTFYGNSAFVPNTSSATSGYVRALISGLTAIYPYAYRGGTVPPPAIFPANRGWKGFKGIRR